VGYSQTVSSQPISCLRRLLPSIRAISDIDKIDYTGLHPLLEECLHQSRLETPVIRFPSPDLDKSARARRVFNKQGGPASLDSLELEDSFESFIVDLGHLFRRESEVSSPPVASITACQHFEILKEVKFRHT